MFILTKNFSRTATFFKEKEAFNPISKEQEVDRVKQEGAKNNTVSITDVCSIKVDNYQAKKRTFLKSVFIGIKEGISIPLLPENVLKIRIIAKKN